MGRVLKEMGFRLMISTCETTALIRQANVLNVFCVIAIWTFLRI